MEIAVWLPRNIPVEPLDLCSLFCNLLDNAIEACRRNRTLPGVISVKADISGPCAGHCPAKGLSPSDPVPGAGFLYYPSGLSAFVLVPLSGLLSGGRGCHCLRRYLDADSQPICKLFVCIFRGYPHRPRPGPGKPDGASGETAAGAGLLPEGPGKSGPYADHEARFCQSAADGSCLVAVGRGKRADCGVFGFGEWG